MRFGAFLAIAAACAIGAAQPLLSQSPSPENPFAGLRARSIGPAVTSGRVM